ncbi:MAG: T9SS type A sorting domain-containing protein [candidate division Zixibacteria bacterium]|nr:T9SS type A sorting domain-containing protein [candidate division Zixibacteria bacterium]
MKKITFLLILVTCVLIYITDTKANQPVSNIDQPVSHQTNIGEEFWQQAANSISPGMFPVETIFQQTGLGICGTQYTLMLTNPEADVPEYFKALAVRPELVREYDTPEGNFKIHYDPTGINAPYQANVDTNPADGHPDFINAIGNFAEYCWAYEIDTLGFNSPPADDWYPDGGDERYDIYVLNLSNGTFGLTAPDETQDGWKYTSFIQIDNDYTWVPHLSPFEAAAVTMAHEFFHSIQLGYDATEYNNTSHSPWWFELSAVWMEEQVYDNINDYINYLPYFFDYPAKGLTKGGYSPEDNLHPYASCVWGFYLTEKYDAGATPSIMRQIWERCGEVQGYNAISAMDEVLLSHSSSLNSAFAEFATWNYFTADRADTIHEGVTYEEAHTWYIGGNPTRPIQIPDSVMVEITEYPEVPDTTSPGEEVPYAPEFLAANYVKFRTTNEDGGLRVGFNGRDNVDWEVVLMGANDVPSIYAPRIKYFDLDNSRIGLEEMYSWTKYSHVVMIPCAVGNQTFTIDATYRYFAEFDTLYSPMITVWPGDLDNNGVVEAEDILPLAQFWYETGPERNTTGYNWDAHPAVCWDFADQTYADADGSGVVDIKDFLPICLNWDLSHGGILSSGSFTEIFDVESHRDVLITIYNQVQNAEDGPQYQIRRFIEDLLDISLPSSFLLCQNYPNPFNEETVIKYLLRHKGIAKLEVYDLLGRKVDVLLNEYQDAGEHSVIWDCKNYSSGIYFYRLSLKDSSTIKKMVLIK